LDTKEEHGQDRGIHVGRFLLSDEQILEWLGMTEGKLRYISISEDYRGVIVIVEDNDSLPVVQAGEIIPFVIPTVYDPGIDYLLYSTHSWRKRLSVWLSFTKKCITFRKSH